MSEPTFDEDSDDIPIIDENRNLVNIITANVTSYEVLNWGQVIDVDGYWRGRPTSNIYVSANSNLPFSTGQLNFNNTSTVLVTLTEEPSGNANVEFQVVGGFEVSSNVYVSVNSGPIFSTPKLNFNNTDTVLVTISSEPSGNANVEFQVVGATGAQGATGSPGAQGSVGAQGASGSGGVRTTNQVTTNVLDQNETQYIDLEVCASYHLLSIETNVDSWVRLYSTNSARTADASRAENVDPVAGTGIYAEVRVNGLQIFTPGTFAINMDTPPTNMTYIAITNRSAFSLPITLTLTKIQIE